MCYAVKQTPAEHIEIAKNEVRFLGLFYKNDHINLVNYYESKHDRRYMNIFMPRYFCNLHQYLEVQDRFPAPLAKSLLHGVGSGLHHMHKPGVIHRDINPWNILLSLQRDGISAIAKLCNFGLSIQLELGVSTTMTVCQFGDIDSRYRAPELEVGAEHGKAVDVYALGCIGVLLTTGYEPPYNPAHLQNDVEAQDLFPRMMAPIPEQRITLAGFFRHPYLWNSRTRLKFLIYVSDFLQPKGELCPRIQ